MKRTKAHPIGETWTRVLLIVEEAALITTEGVAVQIYPLAPGQLHPERRALGVALQMLGRMAARGYVSRARPWARGRLWAVGDAGREVLEQMAHPPARRYRTSAARRARAQRHRDRLRAERRCINGREHARPRRGIRCPACQRAHRGD